MSSSELQGAPSESAYNLLNNVVRAKSALNKSQNSLHQVYDLPLPEGIANRYRKLLVSLVMLDRSTFVNNMHELNQDTMMITEICATDADISEHASVVFHKVAQAVSEFNKKAQDLMIRFSNALSRSQALRIQVDTEVLNIRRQEKLPTDGKKVQKHGLLIKTAQKVRAWFSAVTWYARTRFGRRGSKGKSNGPNEEFTGEVRELLVLALALHELEDLFQAMKDLVVSIGHYMRSAENEPEMFMGWFVTDLKRVDEIVQPFEALQLDLVALRAIFSMFEEIMPVPYNEERLAEEFAGFGTNMSGLEGSES